MSGAEEGKLACDPLVKLRGIGKLVSNSANILTGVLDGVYLDHFRIGHYRRPFPSLPVAPGAVLRRVDVFPPR